MISSARACRLTQTFGKTAKSFVVINQNAGPTARVEAYIKGMISSSIIEAAKNGFNSCISYILTGNIINQLKNHGFTVEKEEEENLKYHVIMWDNDASKNRKEVREDYKW